MASASGRSERRRLRTWNAAGTSWPEDLYWHVVDVAVDGPTVTFRVDRKLLGNPVDIYFRVLSTALQNEPTGDEVDLYPEASQPAATFRLQKEWD